MAEPMSPTVAMNVRQRKLIVATVVATLMALALVIIDLAMGGRVDPPALRAAATTLDGTWRFHIGDDPRWADVNTNDSEWESIDMTASPGSHDGDVGLPDYVGGWMAHGHPGYHGYAWYRRAVTIPANNASWEILGPTLVDHGYELYWNGTLLGGSGRLGTTPHVVGTRPIRFALPAEVAGTHGVLAIRVYMLPGSSSTDGGGLHSAPILAPQPVAEQLHHAQWQRTIAGYIVEVIEPIAMLLVIGLAFVYRTRSSHRSFLLFMSVALVLMAARRLNNAIVAWTDMMDLTTYAWLASVMWIPTLAAWAMAWNRWSAPLRSIDVLAIALSIIASIGTAIHSTNVVHASRLAFLILFIVIGVRIARHGPMRTIALMTLVSIMASLFGTELLDPPGIPGIWFPFGIGVSRTQYVYAIFLPLLAFLAIRTFTLEGGVVGDTGKGTTGKDQG